MGITNQFTWSKSRAGMFSDCERKYLLHYYQYWNGWSQDATDEQRRLYKLRALTSVPAWVGIVTHDTIAWLLQYLRDGGKPLPLSKVLAYAQTRINDNWEFSRSKRYWSERRKAPGWFGLIEHELELSLSDITPERAFLQASNCLANLFESDLYKRILESDRSKWIRIEERSFFYLDGVKIWSVPDFMFTRRDGKVEIVDWKTGKQGDDDLNQLAAYTAFARIEHEIPVEDIVATLAYLKGDAINCVSAPASMELVRKFGDTARASMDLMTAKLTDHGGIEPTRKANNPLPIVDFHKTDETWKCNRCNFRAECWPAGVPQRRGASEATRRATI